MQYLTKFILAGAVLVIGIVATVGYLLWQLPDSSGIVTPQPVIGASVAGQKSAPVPRATSTGQSAASTAQSVALSHSKPSGTYRPNQIRELKPVGEVNKKFTITEWSRTRWLYAQSPEEAAWMDLYGYPTLQEEKQLNSATEEQLRQWAEAGDLNAKVSLRARELKKQALTGKLKDANASLLMLFDDAREAGPYGSNKALIGIADLFDSYRELSDKNKTPELRALMSTATLAEQSLRAYSELYGDFTTVYIGVFPTNDIPVNQKIDAGSIPRLVGMLSNQRRKRGESPVVSFVARPETEQVTPPQWFERH